MLLIDNFSTGSSGHSAVHSFVHHQWPSAEREGVERMFELFGNRRQVPDHGQHARVPHRQRPIHVSMKYRVHSITNTQCSLGLFLI